MKNRANADRVVLRPVGDGIPRDYVVEFARAVMAVTCMCDLHATVDSATSVGERAIQMGNTPEIGSQRHIRV